MNAVVIPFPRCGRSPIRIERTDGYWRVICGDQAWPCMSRSAALREALAIADQIGTTVIVRPRGREAGDHI
jgi:hypothetical protein